MECWKDIPGYDGQYRVSLGGEVFSISRQHTLRQGQHRSGHLSVHLRGKTYYVHDLVLTTFCGPRPVGRGRIECRHLDGNPANNDLGNLTWGTVKENRRDRHLLHEVGKFTRDDVLVVRRMLAEGIQVNHVAAAFGVDRHTISDIKNGRSYAHVVG